MFRRITLSMFAGVACLAGPLGAQAKSPPPDSALRGITERGRALAAYDFAAWHGSDAASALPAPAPGHVTRYVARRTDRGWVVVFGRLSAKRDTFLIATEAAPGARGGPHEGYVAVKHAVPKADTGYYRRAVLAIDTAIAEFGAVQRPYNVAVLPAPGGHWWVYLTPAPTVSGVWPLGGDLRDLVSADARRIVARRRLHNAVIEFGAGREPGKVLQAGSHAAVLDDIPEDTDVFHVLTRTPRVPEYIVTDAFMYRIDADGAITLLGRREDILGR